MYFSISIYFHAPPNLISLPKGNGNLLALFSPFIQETNCPSKTVRITCAHRPPPATNRPQLRRNLLQLGHTKSPSVTTSATSPLTVTTRAWDTLVEAVRWDRGALQVPSDLRMTCAAFGLKQITTSMLTLGVKDYKKNGL